MEKREKLEHTSTTDALPVAPSMGPVLQKDAIAGHLPADRRTVLISALAIVVAIASALIAQVLIKFIGLVTNLAFFQRFSLDFVSPADNQLGWGAILVPALGGVLVGIMARYGSRAIRGHGIPEAMEQILTNESRIPARITFLKPISSGIAIGTGGPFGAEGPIIATGGALGSLIGQLMKTTPDERKTLLAAGAAAGMTGTFGSPVSAVLLAIELLVFEFRPRSFIPLCLASAAAAAVRVALVGSGPVFAMPDVSISDWAIPWYFMIGLIVGGLAVWVTKLVYFIEDSFEKLPIHWMWWPALGGLVVGLVGYFAPHTLGVGYDNIDHILSGKMAISAILFLCFMKLISWSISLGSGTSGGTLAPLFTIGGGMGAGLAAAIVSVFPTASVDLRVAALVGMAAIFAGASRALLASVLFAFETTRHPDLLLPLLIGCTGAFLVSCLRMRNTIMTEKIARRGVRVPSEYLSDHLEQILVMEAATVDVVMLSGTTTVEEARKQLNSSHAHYQHQGFPVIDDTGALLGVLTRRRLLDEDHAVDRKLCDLVNQPAVTVTQKSTLRQAAEKMAFHSIGRLPVVDIVQPTKVVGILTRSDLLRAYGKRFEALRRADVSLKPFPPQLRARKKRAAQGH